MTHRENQRPGTTSHCFPADQALADLLEHINRSVDRGEEVDIAALKSNHPEHADRLQELIPTLTALATWGQHDGCWKADESSDGDTAFVDQTLGDFRIIRELGRGGMGTVYEAEQCSMGRSVAPQGTAFCGAGRW